MEALAAVLRDPQIGGFAPGAVRELYDPEEAAAKEAIGELFGGVPEAGELRRRDDLVLLYFSGHGDLDVEDRLHLLFANSAPGPRLLTTALPASTIARCMEHSAARRQIVILDCCYAGAFGTKSVPGAQVGSVRQFGSREAAGRAQVLGPGEAAALAAIEAQAAGYGRMVLTASDRTQVARDRLPGEEAGTPSVFTRHLVAGLRSGAADLRGRGFVTVPALYEYVYREVKAEQPRQDPCLIVYEQKGGPLVLAQTAPERLREVPLPGEVRALLDSPLPVGVQAGVAALGQLLVGAHPGLRAAARRELEKIAADHDSRSVQEAARRTLAAAPSEPDAPAAAQEVEQQSQAQEAQEKRTEAEARRQAEGDQAARAEEMQRQAEAERRAAELQAAQEAERRRVAELETRRLEAIRLAEAEAQRRTEAEAQRQGEAQEAAQRQAAAHEVQRRAGGKAGAREMDQAAAQDVTVVAGRRIEQAERPAGSGGLGLSLRRLGAGGIGALGLVLVVIVGWHIITSGPTHTPRSAIDLAHPSAPDLDAAPDLRPPPVPDGMIEIPAGRFRMGSDENDKAASPNEKPPHEEVFDHPFYLDRTEVTVEAYAECVKAKRCAPQGTVSFSVFDKTGCNYGQPGREKHPMNCVEWSQASAYCEWKGKRLPKENEWEYAARGDERRTYPWGPQEPAPNRLNACGRECAAWAKKHGRPSRSMYRASDGSETTAQVGSYPDGATPEGLLDMAGNVREWTSTNYCDYSGKRCTGSGLRVTRGGSWLDDLPSSVRAADRFWSSPDSRSDYLGFRCARTAP